MQVKVVVFLVIVICIRIVFVLVPRIRSIFLLPLDVLLQCADLVREALLLRLVKQGHLPELAVEERDEEGVGVRHLESGKT